MQGYNVLFQPGYDHAGIATQSAVEKHLATEGKTRQDLGREAFEARVWEWLHEYGGKIMVPVPPDRARRSTTAASGSRWTTRTCAR